ncbi:hypothetical protein [Halobaculum magnesiiphilum]|uniref:Uncharacterized protein n=1 Tax=Halobaculum magnesiiphilum TaxID=1017351 RepID=A0A8T8WDB5_9EURY|nr:hypothetical protein [Halobaculum magnesiiphilum]QZP37724.1 hypothetical protein K6T50_00655 [Halobaculum magnesiiphilum]
MFVAAGVAAVATELLELAVVRSPARGIALTVLTGNLGGYLHALLPFAFVALAVQRGDLSPPASIRAVAAVSLASGAIGRYAGTVLGALVRGRAIPSPLVLVSSADFAVGSFGLGMWAVTVLGIVASGLWALVGAFAGLGVSTVAGRRE